MKKILMATLLSSTLFVSGYSLPATMDGTYTTQLFSDDGRVIIIEADNQEDLENKINENLAVGWYVEPRVKLYALDKEEYVNQSQVEEQLTVGWYLEPVVLLYAQDGRTEICAESKVEEQLIVGWYRTKEEAMQSKYTQYNWQSGDIQERAKYIYYYLKAYGFSNNGIAALLGNMQQESNIQAYTNESSFGVVQWTGSRKKTLFSRSGTSSPTMSQQLDFLIYELQTDYSNLYNCLMSGNSSVIDLTVRFEKEFERAGIPCMEKRKKYAGDWYNAMQSW